MPSKSKPTENSDSRRHAARFDEQLIEVILEDVRGLETLQKMQSRLLAEIRREVRLLEKARQYRPQ